MDLSKKPKYFKYFWDGKFFDWYRLTYSLARKLRDEYCEYFQLPKCAILMDTEACKKFEAGGLYIKGNIVIPWEKNRKINLWTFLHELTHHLQAHQYYHELDTDHGPTFSNAKMRTVRWAKQYISEHIKPSFLNGKVNSHIYRY